MVKLTLKTYNVWYETQNSKADDDLDGEHCSFSRKKTIYSMSENQLLGAPKRQSA